MILKIKKNPDTQASLIDTQIYALTYDTDFLFSLTHPSVQRLMTPYTSGTWQALEPLEITEDDEYVYYHIETQDYYATFAIVGTELIEIQPYQSGIPEIPWAAIILTIIIATALLVFVLFKTGSIYQIEDNDSGKDKEKFLKETNQKWSSSDGERTKYIF